MLSCICFPFVVTEMKKQACVLLQDTRQVRSADGARIQFLNSKFYKQARVEVTKLHFILLL